MGKRMRELDWSQTPAGKVDDWPQSLKTAISIILNSDFPMFIWWGKDIVNYYNDAYIPILGKAKHPRGLGAPAQESWSEIWDVVGPLFTRVMETGDSVYYENLLLFLDRNLPKEETYFTFSYSPIRDDNGSIGGLYCACSETTLQVFGERQMISLRDIANATSISKSVKSACKSCMQAISNSKDVPFSAIYLMDHDDNILKLQGSEGFVDDNQKKKAFPETLTNQSFWYMEEVIEDVRPIRVSNLREQFDDLPSTVWEIAPNEAMVYPIVISSNKKPSGVFIAALNPFREVEEEYTRYLNMLSSQVNSAINTARAYEDEKRRAESLAEIDRAKTIFFSNVSHEFRTPLTLMLGPLDEMVTNNSLPKDQLEEITQVYRNGLRLQKLVNTLLDFSRIEAGRIQANFQPVDLTAFTAELASNFRSAIEKAGMELIVETSPLSTPIYVDPAMWEKIILNLLSNAFKFTFTGSIKVQVSEDDNHAIVTITDTGVGIPARDLPNIFERFKRVEGSKSRSFEGSGIGLSLVQELVKLHGGSIHATSKVGKGTSLVINIPKGADHLPSKQIQTHNPLTSTSIGARPYLEEAEQWLLPEEDNSSSFTPSTPEQDISGDQKPLIVLADDNADMRHYINRLLKDRFDLKLTSNGKTALRAISEKQPQLVISDVMMPEMDGYELLKHLRGNLDTANIPVILLSAKVGEEAKIESVKAGANDYIYKPFRATELIEKVSAQITAHNMRRSIDHRIHELMKQAPAFIAILKGPDHIFDLCNPLYMQLVGPHRNIIGKSVAEALPEAVEQGFLTLLNKVYTTGEPFIGNKIPVKVDKEETGELELAYINFLYQPYKDEQGEVQGIFVHGVDVTEHVNNQMEIEKLLKQKDEFLGVASHELKTPVTSIKAYAQILQHRFTELQDASSVQLVEKMDGQIDRLTALISDLLDVTRMESGRLMLKKELFDFNQLVYEVVEQMEKTSESHALKTQLATDMMLYGDRDRLGQVITNFLSNAMKYSPQHQDIYIRSKRSDQNELVFEVQDFGLGLSEEHKMKVFERFYRVNESGLETYPGLGLGLYISADIIERHQGKVWVESKPGEGSSFYFSVPLDAPQIHNN